MIDHLEAAFGNLTHTLNETASRLSKMSWLLVGSIGLLVIVLVGAVWTATQFYLTAAAWRLAAKESLALVEDASSARSALFANQQSLARCLSQVERQTTSVTELSALLDGTLQRLAQNHHAAREVRDGH